MALIMPGTAGLAEASFLPSGKYFIESHSREDLVIRDGDIVVKGGRVFIPQHKPQGGKDWFGPDQKKEEK